MDWFNLGRYLQKERVTLILLTANTSKVCGLSLFHSHIPSFTLFLLVAEKIKTYCIKLGQPFTGKTSLPADRKIGLKCTWVSMALISGMTFPSFNKIFHLLVTADLYECPQEQLHILRTVSRQILYPSFAVSLNVGLKSRGTEAPAQRLGPVKAVLLITDYVYNKTKTYYENICL